jgi:hypothetical protein
LDKRGPDTIYCIATTGSNTAISSIAQHLAILKKGNDVAVAGDTIYIRGGSYSITTMNTRKNFAFTRTATSNANGADAIFKSWNISGLTLATSDFESLDTAGIYGPRKADGSLPVLKFLRLSATS